MAQENDTYLFPIAEQVLKGVRIDVPECPKVGESIAIVTDGVWLEGKVSDRILSHFAPGNMLSEMEGVTIYSLFLVDIIIDQWDEKWEDRIQKLKERSMRLKEDSRNRH